MNCYLTFKAIFYTVPLMLRRRLLLLLFLGTFLLVGCGRTPVPEPALVAPYRAELSDQQLMAELRQSWYQLEAGDDKVMPRYNELLAFLINRARYDHLEARGNEKDILVKQFPIKIQRDFEPLNQWSDIYGDIIPCSTIRLTHKDIKNHFIGEGLGVPVAGWVKKSMTEKLNQKQVITDVGAIHTMTVYLTFPSPKAKDQRATMHFILRMKKDYVTVGNRQVALAADYSAPLSVIWQLSKIEDAKFLGLLRPEKTVNFAGLSFVEPYDPDKIPVVLTHGLMSSPETFTNLINRLRVMPGVNKHYQFWRYSYPTGVPWLRTSADFLASLNKALDQVDPQRRNPKLKQMVMVGHSMGGLITRLSISEEPWKVLIPFAKKDKQHLIHKGFFIKMVASEDKQKALQSNAPPFKPAKRAIFLATPHRGAPFANNWIAMLGSYIVSLPKTLITQLYKVVTLNEDMLNIPPDKLAREMTSIRQLSPESHSIQGLNLLHTKLPVHSIIGDEGKGNTPSSSDGIVPYFSSHLTWSKSEKIVPADHSVQDSEECAKEVHRILMLHLKEQKQ